MDIRALTTLISTSLFVCISVSLIMFFYKVWWYPIRIQKLLSSQGIKGRSYKFIHGSTKEILNMTFESTKNPMELTHDILPRLQPHLHLWMKVYGRNFLSWHGYKAQLYLTEPDLIKEVLNNKNGVYLKIMHNDMLNKLLGDGIVLAEGEKWYRHRKLANHAFHMENLKVNCIWFVLITS